MGSFRLGKDKAYLHAYSNFTKVMGVTVNVLLLDSCGTVFSGQGISLHYDSQNKAAIDSPLKESFLYNP